MASYRQSNINTYLENSMMPEMISRNYTILSMPLWPVPKVPQKDSPAQVSFSCPGGSIRQYPKCNQRCWYLEKSQSR